MHELETPQMKQTEGEENSFCSYSTTQVPDFLLVPSLVQRP